MLSLGVSFTASFLNLAIGPLGCLGVSTFLRQECYLWILSHDMLAKLALHPMVGLVRPWKFPPKHYLQRHGERDWMEASVAGRQRLCCIVGGLW